MNRATQAREARHAAGGPATGGGRGMHVKRQVLFWLAAGLLALFGHKAS